MGRILPSRKIRKEVKELLKEGVACDNLLNLVLQKGMRFTMQKMVEVEVELKRRSFSAEGTMRGMVMPPTRVTGTATSPWR